MSSLKQNETEEHGEAEYECSDCKDKEVVHSHYEETGDGYKYEIYKPCHCKERKAWKRRFKNSMIPEEFTRASLTNYQQNTEQQKTMYELTKQYLANFPVSKELLAENGMYNFGLIAVLGEQRIRSLPDAERATVKSQHNNFGIGKTHLQIALSKTLIKQGFNVLVISDVSFMDEMMNAKRINDDGESFHSMLNSALAADVLVWDDIGKVKPTQAKEDLYYNIINERYKKQRPIIFNSNEDRGTLADRIGYAASSRLIGSCYDETSDTDYLLETEGQDWRLKKK